MARQISEVVKAQRQYCAFWESCVFSPSVLYYFLMSTHQDCLWENGGLIFVLSIGLALCTVS